MDLTPFWPAFTLAHALFSGLVVYVNECYKLSGTQMIFIMSAGVLLALSPLVFILDWPTSPIFYAAVAAGAPFAFFRGKVALSLSAKFGAGMERRLGRVGVVLTFFVWLPFSPHLIQQYLTSPIQLILILFALCGTVFFTLRLRRCTLSSQAFKMMLPSLLVGAFIPILNKMAMDASPLHSGVYAYVLLQSAFVCAGVFLLPKQRKELDFTHLLNKPLLIAGGLAALFSLLNVVCRNYALALVPHPAYVGALYAFSPIFITIIYKITKHREENVDVFSGFMIVAFTTLLVVATYQF